ncbi:MFS transporter [Cerasibacillus terrae]|uniref:MFS transporter n=1 Tax=Cerasibacillus terrae TaxID=2498845 RepID=A0A5C8NV18_9BACI|nr:MFS transporter [Cerasibacillus terrae]TXL65028.1 MFS transporter [Cerasibacillus terrae]
MSSNIDSKKKNNIKTWLLIVGVLLISANLRAPLTSVGSVISFIREDLGISNALAGSITTLPLLAFALFSPVVPKIAAKIGMEKTIFTSLLILITGIAVRSLFDVKALFIGTLFIGIGIAIGNVLLPAFIKIRFPLKVGIMTGIYGVIMNVFAAIASGLSVPIASINGLSWKESLMFWGVLVIIAIVVWLPQLKENEKAEEVKPKAKKEKNRSGLLRSSLAWNITLFMGIQSLIFYTLLTWLPDILFIHGYSADAAGWMLFLYQFAIIPATFVVPIMAERMKNQKLLAGSIATLFFVGIVGLLTGATSLIVISIIVIGVACGSAFSLSMMFFALRTTNGKQAAAISGMAQSFGYLLAAFGPFLFGWLKDLTNSWTYSIGMLLFCAAVLFIVGIRAGADEVISDGPKKKYTVSTNQGL